MPLLPLLRAPGASASCWPWPWVGACLDATSTLVPITVLQLLVVEVFRKGREYPPVMRGWWAILLTLQLGASASELELRNAIFALEPTVVLLLTVVMLLRKGQEYPLVLRSSVATLMTVCFVDSSVTGVVLEPGARTLGSGLGFPLVFAGAGPKDREQ